MKDLLKNALSGELVSRFVAGRSPARTVILLYHDLRTDDDFTNWMRVSVSEFDRQMARLADLGDFIGPDELHKPATGKRLRFLITFDDGYRNYRELAAPILRRYGAPALFFISTGHVEDRSPFWPDIIVTPIQTQRMRRLDLSRFDLGVFEFGAEGTASRWDDIDRLLRTLKSLGNTCHPTVAAVLDFMNQEYAGVLAEHLPRFRPLTFDEIAEMAADPLFHFGSHGHYHDILTYQDAAGVRDSLQQSRRLLEEMTGGPVTQLAYPNGDYDSRIMAQADEAGYTCAYTNSPGFVDVDTPLMALPRLGVGGVGSYSLPFFQLNRLMAGELVGQRHGRSAQSRTPTPAVAAAPGTQGRRANSGPIRVLYCIDNLDRGGTELQLTGLIDRLDRSRIEPYLFTLRDYSVESFPVDCRHLAKDIPRILAPSGLVSVASLARWLRKNRIDIVHTFFQDATIVGGLAARLAGVPVRLASFRDMGFWRTVKQEWLLRRVYRSMTGYVTNSEVVKEYFAREFGLPKEKFYKIFNGIEATALPWVEHAGPTLRVAIVGNLNRRVKRTDLFIRAAAALAPDFPEVSWHILGAGEFRTEYEELAAGLGLGDRIVFAGSVDDVAGYLESVQVGVISSDSEGLSNALLEYMFKGCAVVATAVGGNTELVRERETGLLVPPDDPDRLAVALRELLENPGLRQELARNARRFAEENFGWDRCLTGHEALYGVS